jgi:hypothetical protein
MRIAHTRSLHNNTHMPGIPMKQDEGGPIPAEWKLSCLQCGYDLTGLKNRICPECGTMFSPRQTWEANRAGVVPREKAAPSQLTRLLVVGGVVAAVLLLGQLSRHPVAGVIAAVVILLCEVWIHFSSVRPVLPRIFAVGICIIILMFIVL